MAERIGDLMNWFKKNVTDILTVIGITLISIGAFKFNTIIGFIATGLMIVMVAFLMSRVGDEIE